MKEKQVPVMELNRFFAPGEHFHMQISTDFPNYLGIPHRHEYIEAVYVICGTATHSLSDRTYRVNPGDCYIIDVDTVHSFCEDADSAEPLIVYDLMFTPEFFDKTLKGSQSLHALAGSELFSAFRGLGGDISVTGGPYTAFGELFNRMYQEYRGKGNGYMEMIRAYLLQVLITALRVEDTRNGDQNTLNKKQVVQRVARYIEKHYDTRISVRELAEDIHLNPDYLGRVFKEVTGETVSQRIQKVRIGEACRFLCASEMTIADVAFCCGFNDVKFFYGVFKKYTGLNPSEYRKKNGKQSE